VSSSHALVTALKAELKAAGVTYAELARRLGLAESTVKRLFAKADMPLSRVDAVLRVLGLEFADLARKVADAQPLREALTLEQEAALVVDPRLLLVAICVLSQWTAEQITAAYRFNDAQCMSCLRRLDEIGFLALRPERRYRLKVAKGFRWQPNGPVMAYFREHAVGDFFGGGFDGAGETLMVVHGEIGLEGAAAFNDRLQRLGQDFAQQHVADQKRPAESKRAYTVVIGMRSWLFAGFRDLRREPPQA
jgi:transcriptional regulator with XRE-family HTH domain